MTFVRDMTVPMSTALIQRLKTALEDKGRSARDVSLKATGQPDTLRDILRGKNTNPSASTLSAIERELGVNLEWPDGGAEQPRVDGRGRVSVIYAQVIHAVQAGPFLPIDMEFADEDDPKVVPTVPDPAFPRLPLFAYLVRGDSIDRVCPAGGYAICVNFADTGLSVTPGMWVVAERQRGDLVERTVKQVRSGRNGKFELHPHSTNPAHKPIRFPSVERGEEVRVHALVRRFESATLTW